MERDGLRSHLSGTLPLSIALHLAALLMIFVIPLVANVVVPSVIVTMPDYVRLAPLPPPPEVLVATAPRVIDAAPRDATTPIPTVAPPTIQPEMTPPLVSPGPLGPEVTTGMPPGTGALTTGAYVSLPPPPPEPMRQGPVRVADLPIAPRKTVDVRPIYPDVARIARIEGTVVLEAVLDTSGHVTQLRVIQSAPMLDAAAMDAVRQWRYTPSLYGGRPVSVLMTITIRFKLQ